MALEDPRETESLGRTFCRELGQVGHKLRGFVGGSSFKNEGHLDSEANLSRCPVESMSQGPSPEDVPETEDIGKPLQASPSSQKAEENGTHCIGVVEISTKISPVSLKFELAAALSVHHERVVLSAPEVVVRKEAGRQVPWRRYHLTITAAQRPSQPLADDMMNRLLVALCQGNQLGVFKHVKSAKSGVFLLEDVPLADQTYSKRRYRKRGKGQLVLSKAKGRRSATKKRSVRKY